MAVSCVTIAGAGVSNGSMHSCKTSVALLPDTIIISRTSRALFILVVFSFYLNHIFEMVSNNPQNKTAGVDIPHNTNTRHTE